MDQVKPVIAFLKPYDVSASKLLKGFGQAGVICALLVTFGLFLVIKLRLLSKVGLYLGGVGVCFLGLGVALLFNGPLLIFGNVLILAGLVLVVGFERTKVFVDIFKTNMCCGRAMAKAGFVIFISGLLAEVLTKLPIIGRLIKYVPFVSDIVQAHSDAQIITLARCTLPDCYEPEPEPWTTPGRLRSNRGKKAE